MNTQKAPDIFAPLPEPFDGQSIDGVCAYVQQVVHILERYSAVHNLHPERFFEYFGSFTNQGENCSPHLNRGLSLSNDSHELIRKLCREFASEIDSNELPLPTSSPKTDTLVFHERLESQLGGRRGLIRGGPKHSSSLLEFYKRTSALMLRRSWTDFQPLPVHKALNHFCINQISHSQKDKPFFDVPDSALRDALLSNGMCGKKKHEVLVMHKAVEELLELVSNTEDSVVCVNFGEGKGYMSRVISLCSRVPVVGIDCNPLHKDSALRRMEPILDVASSFSPGSKGCAVREKLKVNVLQRDRGAMYCVTARVEDETDWGSVLKGRVPVLFDGENDLVPSKDDSHGLNWRDSVEFQRIQCSLCMRIFSLHSAEIAVKHIFSHAKQLEKEQNLRIDSVILQNLEQIINLRTELSAEELLNHILQVFYLTGDRVEVDACCVPLQNADDEPDIQKKLTFYSKEKAQLPCEQLYSRGTTLQLDVFITDAETSDTHYSALFSILGHDSGNKKYKIYIHSISKRFSLKDRVYILQNLIKEGEFTSLAETVFTSQKNDILMLPVPYIPVDVLTRQELGVALSRIPLLKPLELPLRLPSFSNAVLLGLHPCGDLGSTICRFFSHSSARALLLISCCWQSLTDRGFPLSSVVLRSSLRTNSLALILATQPYDVLCASSALEHVAAARIIFYRSLFRLLWVKAGRTLLQETCADPISEERFAKYINICPSFERTTLKELRRKKMTLTFPEFVSIVAKDIFSSDNQSEEKILVISVTLGISVNKVCSYFNRSDELNVETGLMRLAYTLEEKYVTGEYFVMFLGLTILRLWLSHLIETLLLLDRLLYLYEELCRKDRRSAAVGLVPLFDSTISPRHFAIVGMQ